MSQCGRPSGSNLGCHGGSQLLVCCGGLVADSGRKRTGLLDGGGLAAVAG
jgi:hypothetical protein